jgi:hypothetical protein
MSDAARIAWRMAIAIAMTLFCFFLLHIPNSFRALNTVAMLCTIPIFMGNLMRQRLLLIWLSGLMGMAIDILFREAPWLYLPAFMVLIYTTMHIASRSRDMATMLLLVFGYSGSVPTTEFFAADPVIEGFQRTIGVTLGVVMAITAFAIFPVKKVRFFHRPEPVKFDRRNLLFLSLSGGALLCVGATLIHAYATFVVMLGLAWAIVVATQSIALIRLQLLGLALGNCMGLALLSVFSASSNNLAFFITTISAVSGITVYVTTRFLSLKPAQGLFMIGYLVPCTFSFKPLQDLTGLFPVFISMWLGVLVSSLLFLLFRCLEEVEKRVLTWGIQNS